MPKQIERIVEIKETGGSLGWMKKQNDLIVKESLKGKPFQSLFEDVPVEFSETKDSYFYLNEEEDLFIYRDISSYSRDVFNPG